MAAPTFAFAIGRAYRKTDLDIALAVGQRVLLVPAGSLAAQRLRAVPNISLILDSEAFPPGKPNRISLEGYWHSVLAWRRSPGDWSNLCWFATYDTIGDPIQTQRDAQRLQALIQRDAPDAPVMPIVGYGMPIVDAAHAILSHPLPEEARPSYGIGGLTVERYSIHAERWFNALLQKLEVKGDLNGIRLHLFGISRASWVLRAKRGLVTSCDSSAPARRAAFAGWQGILPRYTPIYGVSAEKLQTSREARLHYHLAPTRRTLGLPFQIRGDHAFVDDLTLPWGIQHTLPLDGSSEQSHFTRT